jgi:hypothetical protein
VAEPLSVEVPNADLAHALMRRLRSFPTELMDDDGCSVHVTLVGNPDRAIGDVLHEVDRWLLDHQIEAVRVRLGDHAYRLARPPGPS